MEKIDLLVWDAEAMGGATELHGLGIHEVSVGKAADVPEAPLLLGRGKELAGLVQVWVDNVDVWPELVARVPSDAYLVTESVPQPVATTANLLTHLTWFPKPERLTEAQFFHGWHVIHTPSSAELHPNRQGYVRDAATRTLTDGSPPIRAIVCEYFSPADYLNPARLFGSKEALQRTMDELPSYADAEDLSSRPIWQTTYLPRG
ncbi:MAG: hypothetical protein JWN31_1220 [Frankiales bacterium]|nr:hypothetical protein [Frankiales bacterium]